jgi:hypothetical protein
VILLRASSIREAWGRAWRSEHHTLVTYSCEIPDSGAFARPNLQTIAEQLVSMYTYVARLQARGEAPEEQSAVVRDMQAQTDRTVNLSDRQSRETLNQALVDATGGDPSTVAAGMRLLLSDADQRRTVRPQPQ